MENRKKGQKSILDICTEWAKNKLINPLKPINPLTNYSIKKNSAKYNELEKLCFNVKIDNIKKEDNIIDIKETVCISAEKIYDSCCSKDCIDDLVVIFRQQKAKIIINKANDYIISLISFLL
jgi:hypothetical protein